MIAQNHNALPEISSKSALYIALGKAFFFQQKFDTFLVLHKNMWILLEVSQRGTCNNDYPSIFTDKQEYIYLATPLHRVMFITTKLFQLQALD